MTALFDFLTQGWSELLLEVVKLATSYLFAFPIAWNRERAKFTAGLRTFPLVAVGATGYLIIAQIAFGNGAESQARVLAGLLGGIGFIGGGAILKEGANVRGTSTAASIWVTGAIGAAVAYGHLGAAFLLSLVTFLTFESLSRVKPHVRQDEKLHEVEEGEEFD